MWIKMKEDYNMAKLSNLKADTAAEMEENKGKKTAASKAKEAPVTEETTEETTEEVKEEVKQEAASDVKEEVADNAEAETTAEEVVSEEKPARRGRPKKEEAEADKTETKERQPLKADSVSDNAPATGRGRRRKLDEMTPAEQIKLHVERNTYSVEKADKETKREMYSSAHVFVEEGDEKYLETETTAKKDEWDEIVSSAGVERILTGTIVQVTEVDSENRNDPDHIPEYMARVRFKTGNWPINIPSYVLYDYDYPNYTREVADSIRRNITRRIGSEVQFVVRYANEKNKVVYGDRLSALSMRGVEHYASIRGRRPDIVAGEQALAQIIAVASNYILVEAYGAEIRIPLDEISWLYVSDARIFDGVNTVECYKVGKRIPVKILSVDFKKVRKGNSNYTLVEATGSIKQTKTNPRIRYYDNYKVNDICSGVVTGRLDDSVFLNINNEMDCKCKVPRDERIRIPVMGDNVVVRITEKNDEERRLKGQIISVN